MGAHSLHRQPGEVLALGEARELLANNLLSRGGLKVHPVEGVSWSPIVNLWCSHALKINEDFRFTIKFRRDLLIHMTPMFTCPECKGQGTVPLSLRLQETLDLVPSNGSVTADAIRLRVRAFITANACSNRLAELLELGLVKRERRGKFWFYTRDAAKPKRSKRP